MIRVFFYGAILLFFISDVVFAGECKSRAPRTHVKYSIDNTQYIRNISAKELTERHSSRNGGRTTGLASSVVGTRISMEYEGETSKENLYCLRVKKINFNFFVEPKIYIASNFKRGSCEYNAVIKHEREHIDIIKGAHKDYVPEFKSFVKDIARELPSFFPMPLTSMDSAKDEISAFIQERVGDFMNVVNEDVAERQSEIDTDDEYRKISDRCHRWEEKLDDEDE